MGADDEAVLWRRPQIILHDHLDGGLRPATLLELAARVGHPLPAATPEDLARHILDRCTGRGLVGYGEAFAHTIAVLQDAESLHRVAREAVEDLAADGVVHAELRFAPTLHTAAGLSADAGVEAVLAGLREAAGAAGISVGLIACAMRNAGDSDAVARLAVRWSERGVVALDLAGPEDGWPAAMHRDAFLHARRAGLRVTMHGGEAHGVPSIAQALHLCGAERLGHGVRIDDDITLAADGSATLSPLARLIRDRGVPLEVCPTSNVQTGAAASLAEHPVGRLLELGFAVTISADNRLMSGVGVREELARVADAHGWGEAELVAVQRNAADAAFVEPSRRAELRRLVTHVAGQS